MLLKTKPKVLSLPYVWPSKTKGFIFDMIEESGFNHVHLIGKAGIGKTRYLFELIGLLKKDNRKVIIDCSCYDERDQNAAILEVIRDLTLSQEEIKGYENPYDLIAHQAESKDIIIVIDDFHYTDDSINRFIQKLTHKLREQNNVSVTLITASRKKFSLKEAHNFQLIELDSLPLKETAILIEKECSKNKTLKMFQEILTQESSGNPLYITEAVNIVIQATKDPTLKLNPSDFLSISNVDDLYSLILSTLSESQQNILKAASVIGKRFSYQDIVSLLLECRISIGKDLELLCKKNILIQSETEGEYSFTHDRQLKNAYKNLSLNKKWNFHLMQAKKYKKCKRYDLCGYHYYFSESYEESIKYLTFTARKALRRAEPVKAELFFKRALTAFETSYLSHKHSYIKLQADYCYLLLMQGRLNDAKDVFFKLRKHPNTKLDTIKHLILELEIKMKWMSGDHSKAYACHSLDNLPKTPDHFTDRSRLIGMLSDLGQYHESIKRTEELLQDLRNLKIWQDRSFSPTGLACHVMLSLDYAALGDTKKALKYIKNNLKKIDIIEDGPQKIHALTFTAEAFQRLNRFEEAKPLIEKAYELNLDFKIGIIQPHILSQYAHNLAFFGDTLKALDLFDECISFNEIHGYMGGVPYYKILMAKVYSSMCMGRVAIDILKSAEKIALEQGNDYYLALVYYELSLIIIDAPEIKKIFPNMDAKEYLTKSVYIATQLGLINFIEKCEKAFKCIL